MALLTLDDIKEGDSYSEEILFDKEKITSFIKHMDFLKANGASTIFVCECTDAIHGNQNIPVLERPTFNKAQWAKLIQGLHEIGELAGANNMTITYHHHMGTGVQTHEEVDYLMAKSDPNLLSLLLDTGHLVFAGGDPLQAMNDHAARIKHVHFKDLRKDIFEQTRQKNLSFLEAVQEGVFTVPGDGFIDFVTIAEELGKANYKGWIVVEAEQDPSKVAPLHSAKMGRAYIKKIMGV